VVFYFRNWWLGHPKCTKERGQTLLRKACQILEIAFHIKHAWSKLDSATALVLVRNVGLQKSSVEFCMF